MIEALQFEFMRNALAAGVLISIACGIIGTLVVLNRMVFVSGGVAHAAYGGIGMAFFLGIPPLVGAGIFSILAAVIMGMLTLSRRQRLDTVIGAVWAVGMAVGVIFADWTPGYTGDLMGYLFGSILAVPTPDLAVMAGMDAAIIVLVVLFYKEFLALSYDREFAALRGVPVRALYFLLLVMASVTIVMAIRIVGIILVIALLTIPTAIAERFGNSLGRIMLYSAMGSLVFTTSGLALSYRYNLTSGAAVIMVAAVVYFVFLLGGKLLR